MSLGGRGIVLGDTFCVEVDQGVDGRVEFVFRGDCERIGDFDDFVEVLVFELFFIKGTLVIERHKWGGDTHLAFRNLVIPISKPI